MAQNERREMNAQTQQSVALPAPPHKDTSPPFIERGMPWIFSVLFHVSVGMVMMFLVFFVNQAKPDFGPVPQVTIGDPSPGTHFRPPGQGHGSIRPSYTDSFVPPPRGTPRDYQNLIVCHVGAAGIPVLARGTPDGDVNARRNEGPYGMFLDDAIGSIGNGPGDIGTRKKAILAGINNIIFVIDRSGSMMSDFDCLKYELRRAVRNLNDTQRFHLIFFSSGAPEEFTPKRLVPADSGYKTLFSDYLQKVEPVGKTNPMPAIKRAFEIAKSARAGEHTVICLLSDGAFPDQKAAVDFVAQGVKGSQIHVMTYLFGEPDEAAQEMMKQIAAKGNGGYNFRKPN